jgi:ribonuclease BN (tRNA processing enzyme)
MKIKILRAFNGDAILISFKDKENKNRNILIDGGTRGTYEYNDKRTRKPVSGNLKLSLEEIKQKGEKIDLLILTHVDNDHIDGIVKWFEEDEEAHSLIGKTWFNSGRLIAELFGEQENEEFLIPMFITEGTDTGIKQGVLVENFIEEHSIWDRRIIKDKTELFEFDIRIRIISPSIENLEMLLEKWEEEEPDTLTAGKENDYQISLKDLIEKDKFREDNSVHNGSSIAFILTYESKNLLLLGDAYPSTLINGLKYFGYSAESPLKAELVKVSHHGSKANTSYELLSLIDCDKFIISTNGRSHNLPNKQCLARIISSKPNASLYFNYPDIINEIFNSQDYREFRFSALPCDEEFTI